jgi:hypothetical protein
MPGLCSFFLAAHYVDIFNLFFTNTAHWRLITPKAQCRAFATIFYLLLASRFFGCHYFAPRIDIANITAEASSQTATNQIQFSTTKTIAPYIFQPIISAKNFSP